MMFQNNKNSKNGKRSERIGDRSREGGEEKL